MKKLLSFLLSLTLLAGLGLPALAADSDADARLTAVTAKVKATLGLDTTAYDSFYGDLSEEVLTPVWSLGWTGEGGSLSIQADESGKIFSYYQYDRTEYTDSSAGYAPTFPAGDEAAARAAAQAFLNKVLDASTESVVLEADDSRSLGDTRFDYRGSLLVNGLPSPFTYRVSVRAADNSIRSFYRDDLSARLLSGIPSASASADADAAGELLKSTLALRLEYVLGDNGKQAVLRWLPESGDEYYVDAQTGKLVDLTELYAGLSTAADYGMSGGGAANTASASDESGTKTLTDAELAGISKLEGVKSKEALDALLKQMSALGLGKYSLTTASYRLNSSDGSVSCTLQYTRDVNGGLWRRYVTLDAKTGALQSLYTSSPWYENEDDRPAVSVSAEKAETLAKTFLSTYYTQDYALLALYGEEQPVSIYGGDDADAFGFRFAQRENGYFYNSNYYAVTIDASDGSVSSFSYSFDRDVTFDSAEGLITQAAALDAYFGTYDVQLGYQAVPQALDPSVPDYKPLIAQGYSYLYNLTLTYSLAADSYVSGIDAKTGTPIQPAAYEAQEIAYDDLSGHWAKAQAETLARYGVGWLGASLNPAKTLTQFDALCLLVSVNGYLYDPASGQSGADEVYSTAYNMGLLTPAQRSDSASVSRGELVKLILDAGGYGSVAALTGIFRCSFADESAIPAAYYGYAALAQGLGLVGGDGKGSFAAGRAATRAEAVVMLYNLMSR